MNNVNFKFFLMLLIITGYFIVRVLISTLDVKETTNVYEVTPEVNVEIKK